MYWEVKIFQSPIKRGKRHNWCIKHTWLLQSSLKKSYLKSSWQKIITQKFLLKKLVKQFHDTRRTKSTGAVIEFSDINHVMSDCRLSLRDSEIGIRREWKDIICCVKSINLILRRNESLWWRLLFTNQNRQQKIDLQIARVQVLEIYERSIIYTSPEIYQVNQN